MIRTYLAQINNSYANNAFLPYSVGLLWSHAQSVPDIRQNYELGGFMFMRDPISHVVDRMTDPGLLALSCYIWNWEYNRALAIAVKQSWPDCIVVLGGPEVPNRSQGFFVDNPHVDVLVHGEGETTFAELLTELIRPDSDLNRVNGISFPDSNQQTVKTAARARMVELDAIPSPYTTGLFDQIIVNNPHLSFHASQETNRGCPYSCTFCDWGSAVTSKVRQFSTGRLLDEIEWFGQQKIDLLYNCDANYGILKRDMDLTLGMVAAKNKYNGYPNRFRAAYAKKSDDKVFDIAMLLNDADMNKGVTLSMQSMDAHTLDNIKRSNIKVNDFAALLDRYACAGIPTYTEVILGLPGETVATFTAGLEQILQSGQHDNISIYMCMLLRNSEMADPDYMARHGIVYKNVPILPLHGTLGETVISETNDIIIATNTMPYRDWQQVHTMSILIQALHCLGLTQVFAVSHNQATGSYMDFYTKMYDRFVGTDTVLGREINRVLAQLSVVFDQGGDWDLIDSRFGEVSWPLEEFMFLQIITDLDQFYAEILPVASEHLPTEAERLCQLQRQLLVEPGNDLVEYAREIVWYGRKSGRSKKRMIEHGV